MSLEAFNAMDETAHLLSSETNKKMMYLAKEQIDPGNTHVMKLKEMIKSPENDQF
ncbi:MAG TPA: hypothetical protein VK907_11605 [Phnomibacter sp.]|nr:hypothetical protein [Phnomibacter sp.]